MKNTSYHFILLFGTMLAAPLSSACAAPDPPPAVEKSKVAEPSDLVALRRGWQQAKAQAAQPIDRKYAASLEALKLRYTKAGDLTSALAVDSEIKALEASAASAAVPKPMDKAASSHESMRALERALLSGKWNWFTSRDPKGTPALKVGFLPKGKIQCSIAIKWEMVDATKFKVWNTPTGFWLFEMDAGLTVARTIAGGEEGLLDQPKCLQLLP
jgi:hypothetical protein